MKIDHNGRIAGEPTKVMRAFLRKLRHGGSSWSKPNLLGLMYVHFGVEGRAARRLFDDLMKRRILQVNKNDEHGTIGCYRDGPVGHRIAVTRLLKRIPRAKADEVVAALLERAKAINARPELMFGIRRIYVFGSYLTDKPDLGDVDVTVEYAFKARGLDHKATEAWYQERINATAPMSVWMRGDTREWARREVELLIKARDRYLHITDGSHLKTRAKVIFEAKQIAGHDGIFPQRVDKFDKWTIERVVYDER